MTYAIAGKEGLNDLIDVTLVATGSQLIFRRLRLAVKAYKLMANEGIKIPEDIGIIGFDNINDTEYTNQAITSIDQRISDQVNLAIDNLLKILNDEEAQTNIALKVKLIEKETTFRGINI
ncbi:substrate-binding domain-containing protein [uncultured Anaerococcus sp.]|uniref:substrate-binding domain-containing protein n=1 Tax=uncultured Anaerococcus sp. TaxID=293428 RepID=UPI00288B24BE|nr:substrate-binding domain-containing protein [uncultured Anaerococcus sp.]